MTNELGTTLDDIKAKAERKLEALDKVDKLWMLSLKYVWQPEFKSAHDDLDAIRKYIEEN